MAGKLISEEEFQKLKSEGKAISADEPSPGGGAVVPSGVDRPSTTVAQGPEDQGFENAVPGGRGDGEDALVFDAIARTLPPDKALRTTVLRTAAARLTMRTARAITFESQNPKGAIRYLTDQLRKGIIDKRDYQRSVDSLQGQVDTQEGHESGIRIAGEQQSKADAILAVRKLPEGQQAQARKTLDGIYEQREKDQKILSAGKRDKLLAEIAEGKVPKYAYLLDTEGLSKTDKKIVTDALKGRPAADDDKTTAEYRNALFEMDPQAFVKWMDDHTLQGRETGSALGPMGRNWKKDWVDALVKRYEAIKSGKANPLVKQVYDEAIQRLQISGVRIDGKGFEDRKALLRLRAEQVTAQISRAKDLSRDEMDRLVGRVFATQEWSRDAVEKFRKRTQADVDAVPPDRMKELRATLFNVRRVTNENGTIDIVGDTYSPEQIAQAWKTYSDLAAQNPVPGAEALRIARLLTTRDYTPNQMDIWNYWWRTRFGRPKENFFAGQVATESRRQLSGVVVTPRLRPDDLPGNRVNEATIPQETQRRPGDVTVPTRSRPVAQ